MKLKYINEIRSSISIYYSKLASNLLDGTYKSFYKGKSMNFENLREYVVNDDVKDIDWKASARSGNLLVKQFIAEKKHNIMLLMDSGIKMDGDTNSHVSKKLVSLYSSGTLGYLAIKNGDFVGMSYLYNDKVIYKPFNYSLYNLEEYLCEYEKNCICKNKNNNINNTLDFIYKNIQKKMSIFIITDVDGLKNVDKKLIKVISKVHDVLFINIEDNYLLGNDVWDVDKNRYLPNLLLNDTKLHDIEVNIRMSILDENVILLKKYNIPVISISSLDEIYLKIIELLEEHRYAFRS